MIQINLLPDIKRDYLRAQQMKHMFVVTAVIVSIIALGSLALLFTYVRVIQPRHRANIQKDVDNGIVELQKKQNAVKIVTVQGVLEQIPTLQDKKLITSSLFSYLSSFTPKDVTYNEVKLDLEANTITLSGKTTILERANVLANNLKSATFTYKQGESNNKIQPFKGVVFASLGKTEQSENGKSVGFLINFQVDPFIFSQSISDQKITVNASSEELLLPSTKPFSETAPAAVTGSP